MPEVKCMHMRVFMRNVQTLRNNILVREEAFITSRTPLYYLDLPDPNRILYKKNVDEIFPDSSENSRLGTFNVSDTYGRFYPDDSSVGCNSRRDSFVYYICNAEKVLDVVAISTFFLFLLKIDVESHLSSGESTMRFLNFATLCGYEQWREEVVFGQVIGDRVFLLIYPFILKGIYKKKSEHPLLLKKFWDAFCVSEFTRLSLFLNVPDAEHLRFMLEVANQTRFDFWGLRNGGGQFSEFLIRACINENRCDLVVMMLEYGFTIGVKVGETKSWRLENLLTQSSLRFTCEDLLPEGFMFGFLLRCYSICHNPLERPGFLTLYRKLSRSSFFPSLPLSMVRKYLQKVLKKEEFSRLTEEEVTSPYKTCDIHPADDPSVVPQLTHLSRCVIRERLAANYLLPNAIDNFDIPEILKHYLRLDY